MSEQKTVEMTEEARYIAGLVARARAAQKIAEGYNQKRVDELCEAVSFAACNEQFRRTAARGIETIAQLRASRSPRAPSSSSLRSWMAWARALSPPPRSCAPWSA